MKSKREMNDQQRQLVVDNICYADSIAAKYQNRGVCLDDLQQEARLALCFTAMKYNLDSDCKFTTYSTVFVNGWLSKFVMRYGYKSYLSKQQRFFMRIFSLNTNAGNEDDESLNLEEIVSNEAEREERERADSLETLDFIMRHLTPREQQIVSLHAGLDGDPMNFVEMAKDMKISERCLRGIYRDIMNKMVECAENYKLNK